MTAPNAAEIQAIFNRIAPVYDDLNFWLSLGQQNIWKQMAVNWAQPQPGDRGLDICCGSGDLARLLARRIAPDGEMIGTDFSSELLAVAQKKSSVTLQSNIDWVQGDALHLPFVDASFDCATMGYGLRNVTNIPQCLQEIFRVLKPGARAAILDFHQPSTPLLQAFQAFYLQSVVVPVAERYGLTDEYAYIMPSLERFPNGEQQVKLSMDAGFNAIHYPIAGGMMGVLVVTKPEGN
ncbi:MAG: bifunctional demethylmenaquinone methyltransferase/2-methoxy-6-polyprenyl-1,4-benzoquinol methylase UbiE [Thermosynechococcaceae cyanobacterium]